ncbi:hypothetical protein BT63DRAFT_480152 [Microthyrium microscopicum]|uniref:Uncharacterized protein n=1 Tax=Microthyrium microscopicum TaxID=703497 RepID=A0A6A6UBG0_9PEZI|nr:hypothetical protein BT63DRAFT_480152 [Microthyrium microscopicum]
MATNKSKQPLPQIEIFISTSTPTLDILGDETFKIILTATLKSDRPITFPRANTIFEVSTAIHDCGLSFTSVKTGKAARRSPDGLVCSFSASATNAFSTHKVSTLQPNEEQLFIHTLGPFRGSSGVLTDQTHTDASPKGGIWYGTTGLETGTYDISVPSDRCISVWKYAPSTANLWGWWGERVHNAPIHFVVKKTATVLVKQVEDPRDMSVSFQL